MSVAHATHVRILNLGPDMYSQSCVQYRTQTRAALHAVSVSMGAASTNMLQTTTLAGLRTITPCLPELSCVAAPIHVIAASGSAGNFCSTSLASTKLPYVTPEPTFKISHHPKCAMFISRSLPPLSFAISPDAQHCTAHTPFSLAPRSPCLPVRCPSLPLNPRRCFRIAHILKPLTGPFLGLIALFLLAGGLLLQWFLVLSGGINSAPENRFYFLQASTGGIANARDPARWTFWAICGVDANSGYNANCGSPVPALPFDPPRNFGTQDNVPESFIG